MPKPIYDDPSLDDNGILPLVFSVLLHGVIVTAVLFWYTPPKVSEPAGIETLLVGEGEFAEIEGLLRDSIQVGTSSASPTASDTPQISDAMAAYNAELAARQAAYEQQMAEFAAELDAQMEADAQAYENALKELAELQHQELLEAKQAEQNHDNIVRQNQAELNKARERRDEIIAQAEAATKALGGRSGSLGGNSTSHNNTTSQSSSYSGTNANRTTANQTGGGSSASNIASAISRHIYPNWDVPSNAKGERLSARVQVDSQGNVISISISGGSSALRDSLERAIRNSSPLTPIIGTEHRRLTLNFTAEN